MWTAGIILAVIVLALFVLLVCARHSYRGYYAVLATREPRPRKVAPNDGCGYKRFYFDQDRRAEAEAAREMQVVPAPRTAPELRLDSVDEAEAAGGEKPSAMLQELKSNGSVTLAGLPRRSMEQFRAQHLHGRHRDPELYAFDDYGGMPVPSAAEQGAVADSGAAQALSLPAPARERDNALMARLYTVANRTCVPYFEWTVGNVLTVLFYMALNVAALFLSPDNDLGKCSITWHVRNLYVTD